MMNCLIPKVFYDHLDDGLALFAGVLGFDVLHRDESLAVVARDGAKAHLVESREFAAKDRPELSIETDAIHELHAEVAARQPQWLHPAVRDVVQRPWGALEFAVRDPTGVCIVFRQWDGRAQSGDARGSPLSQG